MDTRPLRYFIAIVELGSFTAAARYLGVAQPALSRHMKQLEMELGVRLLVRNARGIRVTDAGDRLFHHAQAIVGQLQLVPDVVGGRSQVVKGTVALGLPTSVSTLLAKPLLRRALERFPEVRIKLVESLSGFLRDWIEQGQLDISVLYDAQAAPGIHLDPLLVEDLHLVGAVNSFGDAAPEITFTSLADYRLILPSPPHSHRQLVENMALSHGIRLRVVLDVDSLTVQKALAEDGLGHILLPYGAAGAEVAAGTLEARPVVAPSVSRSVSLATSAIRGTSRACEEIRLLTLELADMLIAAGEWKGRRLGREGLATPRPEGAVVSQKRTPGLDI